jgi:hypothetical protein
LTRFWTGTGAGSVSRRRTDLRDGWQPHQSRTRLQQERRLDGSAAGEDKGFIGERYDADAGAVPLAPLVGG